MNDTTKPALAQRINVYTCEKCGGLTVTIDVDEGVTPFLILCRAKPRKALKELGNVRVKLRHEQEFECSGSSYSAFYRPAQPHPEPAWEWYKPSVEEFAKMSEANKQHCYQGGLMLRKRATA